MTKELKTWADLAQNYDLVLFNKCIDLEGGAVLEDYYNEVNYSEKDEVFQWYAISIDEFGKEYLNKTYDLSIFYSNTLDLYILPVYHFGTSWEYVNL